MALPNTHIGPEGITSLLAGKKKLFFAGIGGVSMNSLAAVSHLRGYEVAGYDRTLSEITRRLEKMGIAVYYEADEAHVYDADALIYTVAMPETNPEYAWAKAHGIPLISRADYLGWLMTGYRVRIGVSGTHGKSTTTGMLCRILTSAGVDPTVLNGAPLLETGTFDRIGGHDYFAFEACEYMDSFLDFQPTTAIVLNIELDHVDYFHSMDQLRGSFVKFTDLTGQDGLAVLNADDANCRMIRSECACRTVTFGRENPEADYSSANERTEGGYPSFDVVRAGKTLGHVTLKIPGEHNIANAVAAFAACAENGIDPGMIAEGLSLYEGIGRRMERVCGTSGGAAVYADYAHHPTEISVTLKGARAICRGRLRVVFQPHTFSRTAELFDGFVEGFANSGADEVILCDIYPARETNIYGVTSEGLAEAIAAKGTHASRAESFEAAAERMDRDAEADDLVIVMGAGDVIRVAEILRARNKKNSE